MEIEPAHGGELTHIVCVEKTALRIDFHPAVHAMESHLPLWLAREDTRTSSPWPAYMLPFTIIHGSFARLSLVMNKVAALTEASPAHRPSKSQAYVFWLRVAGAIGYASASRRRKCQCHGSIET